MSTKKGFSKLIWAHIFYLTLVLYDITMKIELDHVLIVVKDLEESISFYKLLGFTYLETIQRPNDLVAVLVKDGLGIELMKLHDEKETYRPSRLTTDVGFRHFGFKVDNIATVYNRLKNKINFESEPMFSGGRGERMILFFKDPNGIELHLVQE
jgi:catechol 2,3-dioxygenase-like lactoylglutathione lyase family enzyme